MSISGCAHQVHLVLLNGMPEIRRTLASRECVCVCGEIHSGETRDSAHTECCREKKCANILDESGRQNVCPLQLLYYRQLDSDKSQMKQRKKWREKETNSHKNVQYKIIEYVNAARAVWVVALPLCAAVAAAAATHLSGVWRTHMTIHALCIFFSLCVSHPSRSRIWLKHRHKLVFY